MFLHFISNLVQPLARLGADVVGLDASAELISVAETHKMQSENMDKILYTTNCIEEYSNNNKECFDAVIVSEVLEHIKDKNMFIASCLKTLKVNINSIQFCSSLF